MVSWLWVGHLTRTKINHDEQATNVSRFLCTTIGTTIYIRGYLLYLFLQQHVRHENCSKNLVLYIVLVSSITFAEKSSFVNYKSAKINFVCFMKFDCFFAGTCMHILIIKICWNYFIFFLSFSNMSQFCYCIPCRRITSAIFLCEHKMHTWPLSGYRA